MFCNKISGQNAKKQYFLFYDFFLYPQVQKFIFMSIFKNIKTGCAHFWTFLLLGKKNTSPRENLNFGKKVHLLQGYFIKLHLLLTVVVCGKLRGRPPPPEKLKGRPPRKLMWRPPPGWKSVGMSPLWKKFKSFNYLFASTHKLPEFEITQNPGGGGINMRAAPRKFS